MPEGNRAERPRDPLGNGRHSFTITPSPVPSWPDAMSFLAFFRTSVKLFYFFLIRIPLTLGLERAYINWDSLNKDRNVYSETSSRAGRQNGPCMGCHQHTTVTFSLCARLTSVSSTELGFCFFILGPSNWEAGAAVLFQGPAGIKQEVKS